jgi:hypothetical protein
MLSLVEHGSGFPDSHSVIAIGLWYRVLSSDGMIECTRIGAETAANLEIEKFRNEVLTARTDKSS